jgi:oligopeptide/dipeptide ABC transporter ATP-binding protein
MASDAILELDRLETRIRTESGTVHPLRGVSFTLERGRVLALLGESGSGKSITLKSILRVLPQRSTEYSGRVLLEGVDLLTVSEGSMANVRGDHIAMVYQDPVSTLDPVYPVGKQIVETIRRHQGLDAKTAQAHAIELLAKLGIPSPATRLRAYPHEMSGGMCQRVMIAIALACKPSVLLADEPTSALDVTVQAQILDLLRELVRGSDTALIIVTHDVGVAAELADEVAVMYAGQIVERGSATAVLESPQHPYTRALIAANVTDETSGELPVIPGQPPDIRHLPRGCAFAARCAYASARCDDEPPIVRTALDHEVRCVLAAG